MPSIDPRRLAGSVRRLTGLPDRDIVDTVDQVVHACVALFGVSGSGLMIADEQAGLHYVGASDGPSHILEKVQSETGEGPCVDAFLHNDVVACADVGSDARWPSIRSILLRHGITAVLGSPLRIGGTPVGTINVYHDKPHDWDDSERAALTHYGEVIEATLTAAVSAHAAGEIADQLQYALDYRVVIERAIGYLMAQRRLDAAAAFNVLRRSARDQRRKIDEVARQMLDTGSLGPTPEKRRPPEKSRPPEKTDP